MATSTTGAVSAANDGWTRYGAGSCILANISRSCVLKRDGSPEALVAILKALELPGDLMPLLSFLGCHARVRRAEDHTDAFAKAWSEFLEGESYAAHLEIEVDGTGTLSVVSGYEPLPAVFSLELGEILYQLRAALDAAIYACAIEETGEDPPPNARNLEFPICDTAESFKKSERKISPLTGQRRQIVEAFQPFSIVQGLDPESAFLSPHRALAILNDWARKDRHRTLHVVGSWGSRAQPMVAVPPPATLAYLMVTHDGFLEHDCEVAAFKVDGYTAGMDVKANPNMFIDIAVDEGPPPSADNDTLGNRLKAMRIAVGAVVNALEASCVTLHRKRPVGG